MASLAAPSVRAKSRKASRIWWHVHQWVGLKLAIVMSFVCLTGTLSVLSNEVDWLMLSSLRVAPASVTGEPQWERIAQAASTYPGVQRVQVINAPTASAFAAKATVIWQDDRLGFLHIHPITGKVQGVGHWVNAQRILRNLHRHLNLPTKYGIPLVCSMALLLAVSLGTSFVVYKKWWRGFLKMPRRRDARTWWGDFHRLAGVWTLWFVALITATGIWYLVETLGGDANVPQVKNTPEFTGTAAAIGERFTRSLAAARAADPELHIETIRFPTKKSGAFIFGGQKNAVLVRERANTVWTQVANAKVLAIYDGRDLSVHQRISEMADPLHFGTFGGYWTKALWFLAGGLLTALSVSGMAIYALRIGRELKQATPPAVAWSRIWAAMGHWRWLACVVVATGLALIPTLFSITAD
jgi:uncharacterized iron-regulated membrane protein